jgi:hypothetical protein
MKSFNGKIKIQIYRPKINSFYQKKFFLISRVRVKTNLHSLPDYKLYFIVN